MRKTDIKYYLNFLFPIFFSLILFLLGAGAISLKEYGIPFSMGGSINRLIFICFFISLFIDKENKIPLSARAENLSYIYIIWLIFASFFQDFAGDAISYLVNLLVFPVTFLLGLRMAAFPKYSKAVFLLIISGAVVSVFRLPPSDSEWLVMNGLNRFSGAQGHPNFSGFYYALVLILSLNLIFTKKISSLLKFFVFPASFILIWGLLNTYSRSSWVGVIAAFALFLFFWLLNSKKLSVNWLLTFIVISIIAVMSLPMERAKVTLRAKDLIAGDIDESSRERIYCWSSSWELIKEKPVTGIGPGNERFKKNYIKVKQQSAKLLLPHPHNVFLYLAISAGIPGLLLFFTLLLIVIGQVFINFSTDDHELWASSLTALGIILCLFIAGMFDSFFISAHLNAIFGALLACVFNNQKQI